MTHSGLLGGCRCISACTLIKNLNIWWYIHLKYLGKVTKCVIQNASDTGVTIIYKSLWVKNVFQNEFGLAITIVSGTFNFDR